VTETRTAASERPGEHRLHGWQVLACLLVFFAVVLAVNAAMIYWAVSTYSGVVASEPYRKGLHYNARVRAAERQQQLHWQDVLTIDRDGQVRFVVTDADGSRIRNLSVEIAIGRPSSNREDSKLVLTADSTGDYRARISALPPGSWIIGIEARRSAADPDPIFRARRRLWIAP